MRVLRLSAAGAATVVLLGGLGGTITAQERSEPVAFPTGSFVSVENPDMLLEFHEDGTGVSYNLSPAWYHSFTYAVDDDTYTWLSADWDWEPYGQPTKTWTYDGELLAFESLGEDRATYRDWVYAANTCTPVEDPHRLGRGLGRRGRGARLCGADVRGDIRRGPRRVHPSS
jgi:hypothetical protein